MWTDSGYMSDATCHLFTNISEETKSSVKDDGYISDNVVNSRNSYEYYNLFLVICATL